MSEADSVRQEVERHDKRDALARLVRTVALSAADEQRARLGDGLDELLADNGIGEGDGVVGSIDVVKALARAEPPVLAGRMAVALLLARGIALEPPDDEAAATRLAEQLTWLSCHSWVDALWCLDGALDDASAARVWEALATLVEEHDGRGAPKGRSRALAAAAALGASSHPAAVTQQRRLAGALRDPLLASLVRAAGTVGSEDTATVPLLRPSASLSGELVPVPLGPVGLVLWSLSGLILVRYLLRFVANVILQRKRPADVTIAHDGVTLRSRLCLLGRTIRESDLHIPLANLAKAERQVRYPRLGLYAGLLALALGTYLGTWLVTDGARAGSPSLIGIGALIVASGVAIDFIFSTLLPAGRQKHRLVLVPRSGRAFALSTEDPDAAQRALTCLAPSQRPSPQLAAE